MPRRLSREHRRFLIVDEILGSIVINFPLNAGIAWGLFRSKASVPLWGMSSIAADTIVTAFVLTIATAFLATRYVRAQVIAGKLPPVPISEIRSSAWLQRSSFVRGTILAVAAVVLAAVPVIAAFAVAGPRELPFASFLWFKATFAAVLGAVVTPLVGWWALCDVAVPKLVR
jgi:hypothetical protein